MELRYLKTFRTVAETGGFTRAGEVLGYAQSTVTAHIRTLEEEMGTLLFDRLGKRSVLTEAGEKLLPFAEKMDRLYNEAIEVVNMDETPTGRLRIGAPESLLVYRLPALLHEYRERYPKVRLELTPGQCKEMPGKLKEGDMDLAFLLDEECSEKEFNMKTLIQEELVMVCAPDHELAKENVVTTKELTGQTILQTERGCTYRLLLEQRLKEGSIGQYHRIDFWSVEAIKQCTISGLGISYLPYISVMREIDEGRLINLPWMYRDDRVYTQLIWHKDKQLSPAMQRFIELSMHRTPHLK
ncbi:DNA-binding transcriptional regulator, LysR family [Marininema mesophilum]|uniref:DNA-binding transcriptional regulator, LysR family n=1 Tax=Marininema mesophilum TaxID=1048340 RepID=A0A1H2Z2B3_9BACL|nr:LysR family transcriptional regulator [Marininema mesophilum]SDX11506.1 DNA-binding transcriptional regulator, LysR family [Marininema mesophilum]